MKKTIIYAAGTAVAVFTAIAAIQPARALPIQANGSFALAAQGASTVNTGDIALDTATKTDPAQLVSVVTGSFTAGIQSATPRHSVISR